MFPRGKPGRTNPESTPLQKGCQTAGGEVIEVTGNFKMVPPVAKYPCLNTLAIRNGNGQQTTGAKQSVGFRKGSGRCNDVLQGMPKGDNVE